MELKTDDVEDIKDYRKILVVLSNANDGGGLGEYRKIFKCE